MVLKGAGGHARLHGLPPIIDPQARVLILGSFPSVASLSAGQYYAHRQNQFWRILGELLGKPLQLMDYGDRCRAILAARLVIWDVYASCERSGSLDAAIRSGHANDFPALKLAAPQLRRVCFNGQSAGKYVGELAELGVSTCILPSTSPANATWSFERKLLAWREGLQLADK
jgi:TDG/mug DNA glycosylase family protein